MSTPSKPSRTPRLPPFSSSPSPKKVARSRALSTEYKAIPEFYDSEYEHLEYLQQDVPFLLSKLGNKKQVLEIATGTGRAAIPLAQSGHRVVGVDYDGEILAIAKRKRDFVGVTDKQLVLLKGDARSFRIKDRFDAAVILFNTLLAFPTAEDMGAVLETCHAHVKKGGVLWIDIFNPDLTLLSETYSYGLDPVTFYVPSLDRTVSRTTDLSDIDDDGRNQVRDVTFNYRWYEEGEEKYQAVFFQLTWMMPRELGLVLEKHGFSIQSLWGDYDGSPVTTTSPRIICQAKRI